MGASVDGRGPSSTTPGGGLAGVIVGVGGVVTVVVGGGTILVGGSGLDERLGGWLGRACLGGA